MREVDGTERVQRACTTEQEHSNLLCGKTSNTTAKSEATYQVECCWGELCNGGPFPVLEKITSNYYFSL